MLQQRQGRSNNNHDGNQNTSNDIQQISTNITNKPQQRRRRRRIVPQRPNYSKFMYSIVLCFLFGWSYMFARFVLWRSSSSSSNINDSIEKDNLKTKIKVNNIINKVRQNTIRRRHNNHHHDKQPPNKKEEVEKKGKEVGLPAYPKMHRSTNNNNVQLSPDALEMCTQGLWHTLKTTTIVLPHGETFVHTGDIDDMWIRDSAAQVHPYLIPAFPNNDNNNGGDASELSALVSQDPKLDRIVSGLIKRTAMYIAHDPYANAFRIDTSYKFSPQQKAMGRHDLISTWNYELDSGCYFLRLLYFYYKSNSPLSLSTLQHKSVINAVKITLNVWIAEQKHELNVIPQDLDTLLKDCQNCHDEQFTPYRYPSSLPRNGKGSPTNATSGLTWTGFRPSDDECLYHYLIPANMFAVTVLEYVVELSSSLWKDPVLHHKAKTLSQDIQRGIQEHAIIHHPTHGHIYAYEVDGLGNHLLMDDANVPNLLSLPYLGYPHLNRSIYENTRNFIFSNDNPTFVQGTNKLMNNGMTVQGYGSPHMEQRIRNNIWPMAMAVQGLVEDDVNVKVQLVNRLVEASAGTLWMHESFDVGNPKQFTRSWFCWADALFGTFILFLFIIIVYVVVWYYSCFCIVFTLLLYVYAYSSIFFNFLIQNTHKKFTSFCVFVFLFS